jgi:Protein of unknown function (DUF2442)
MRIAELKIQPNWILIVVADDGRVGHFDVSPYLQDEAFEALQNESEFAKVINGGYFIEWDCGADLSADTIEARWRTVENTNLQH